MGSTDNNRLCLEAAELYEYPLETLGVDGETMAAAAKRASSASGRLARLSYDGALIWMRRASEVLLDECAFDARANGGGSGVLWISADCSACGSDGGSEAGEADGDVADADGSEGERRSEGERGSGRIVGVGARGDRGDRGGMDRGRRSGSDANGLWRDGASPLIDRISRDAFGRWGSVAVFGMGRTGKVGGSGGVSIVDGWSGEGDGAEGRGCEGLAAGLVGSDLFRSMGDRVAWSRGRNVVVGGSVIGSPVGGWGDVSSSRAGRRGLHGLGAAELRSLGDGEVCSFREGRSRGGGGDGEGRGGGGWGGGVVDGLSLVMPFACCGVSRCICVGVRLCAGRCRDGAGAMCVLAMLAPVLVSTFVSRFVEPAHRRVELLEKLTPTQREVAALLVEGLAEMDIAKSLNRSRHTVHDHVRGIYRSWQVRTKAEARDLWLSR